MSTVLKMEDILKQETAPAVQKTKKDIKVKPLSMPRGNPKSGRIWKSNKQRFKSIVKTPGIKKSNALSKQMKLKNDLLRVKTISRARAQDRLDLLESKKERRRKNLERSKLNQSKSDVIQVIKNPSKIKKMKRKQLRSIEKRDTTKISQ